MLFSRPSDTAKLIARSILLASHDENLCRLVPEEEPELLRRILHANNPRDRVVRSLEWAPARRLLLALEGCLLPGIIIHYLARKRQIESAIEKAIDDGCRQVVVVAAGYDTLAWRLHCKHPGVRFLELDHPATQKAKQAALGEAANLSFSPLDLTVLLPSEVLARNLVTHPGPTVFLVEGLTMYLPAARVAELMRDLSHSAGPGGRVIFTFMERDDSGSIQFRGESRLISRWLQARGEPFLWGVFRDELPGFLESNGLELMHLADDESLRKEQLRPQGIDHLPLAVGELIGTACPTTR